MSFWIEGDNSRPLVVELFFYESTPSIHINKHHAYVHTFHRYSFSFLFLLFFLRLLHFKMMCECERKSESRKETAQEWRYELDVKLTVEGYRRRIDMKKGGYTQQ